MLNFLNRVWKRFRMSSQEKDEYEFLAGAKDLAELEWRMKHLRNRKPGDVFTYRF